MYIQHFMEMAGCERLLEEALCLFVSFNTCTGGLGICQSAFVQSVMRASRNIVYPLAWDLNSISNNNSVIIG